MQTNGNPLSYSIAVDNQLLATPPAPAIPLIPAITPVTDKALASLPGAAKNSAGTINLFNAIDASTRPQAQAIQTTLPSTTAWAMQDVSHLAPQATPVPVVSHDWLSGILTAVTTFVQHLFPAFHPAALLAGLPVWLSGLAPWLLTFLGFKALQGVFQHVVPKTRGAAEYETYTTSASTADQFLAAARANGGSKITVTEIEDGRKVVNVPRYQLGVARNTKGFGQLETKKFR